MKIRWAPSIEYITQFSKKVLLGVKRVSYSPIERYYSVPPTAPSEKGNYQMAKAVHSIVRPLLPHSISSMSTLEFSRRFV